MSRPQRTIVAAMAIVVVPPPPPPSSSLLIVLLAVLAHYDRLLAKGKKGVAAVRNQVCTGCHMRVPIGVVATLMHDTDIQICESCGRYLYLSDSTKTTAPPDTAKPKPARKVRSPKSSAQPGSTPDPTLSLAMGELAQAKMQPGLRSISN